MTEREWLEIFADNLYYLMREKNYTQEELARAAGVSQTAISMYLNKRKMPGVRAVINLAWELGEDMDDFILFGDRID